MPTLAELLNKFNAETGDKTAAAAPASPSLDVELNAALEDGATKTASAGGNMQTLQEIYLSLFNMDKTAQAAGAQAAPQSEPTEEELAQAAQKLAADEAAAQLGADEAEPTEERVKLAALEYDAAGRIMYRGFHDEYLKLSHEWQKLAASVQTKAEDNHHTESESKAKTPALGERGLPTMPTNFAGSPEHDQPISMKGGREVYKNALETAKKINAGVTGDDPEAAAISIGGGAPMGFATVRDLMA